LTVATITLYNLYELLLHRNRNGDFTVYVIYLSFVCLVLLRGGSYTSLVTSTDSVQMRRLNYSGLSLSRADALVS